MACLSSNQLAKGCGSTLVKPLRFTTVFCMQGIMVRHYAKPELSGFIRISAGRPDQTDLLMKAIHAL